MLDKHSTIIAKKLFTQIQERDDQCALWLVSAISKITSENPTMTIFELLSIIRNEMPNATAQYQKYIRST